MGELAIDKIVEAAAKAAVGDGGPPMVQIVDAPVPQKVPMKADVTPLPQVQGVTIQFTGPTGTFICFWPVAEARQLATLIIEKAKAAERGLVVASQIGTP